MRGEVLGVERRRRWTDDAKLAIVLSVGIDGATVTHVAHRHDVTRQQIYRWRHELKKKGLWPIGEGAFFLPIDFPPNGLKPPASSRSASANLYLIVECH